VAVNGSCETFGHHWACTAQRLGQLDIGWGLGEEKLCVIDSARQLFGQLHTRIECIEDAECHVFHLLGDLRRSDGVLQVLSRSGETKKAADPGVGVRGLEVAG
jgi:hypothetical protein